MTNRGVTSFFPRNSLLQEESYHLAKEMLELPWTDDDDDPDPTSGLLSTDNNVALGNRHVRRMTRLEMERQKFDAHRFMQDLDIEDDYVFQCAMGHPAHWEEEMTQHDPANVLATQLANLSLQKENDFFTPQERQQLMAIPYPLLSISAISDDQAARLVAGLVDLLFAYVYDHLTTSGDPTVESAWTVSTLSATLACLEDWLQEENDEADGNEDGPLLLSAVGHSCLRRSLIYPYLRNYEFSCHCWKQTGQILGKGVRCVIRCLLQLRSILDHSELYYLGNKLWLDPYLAWLQRDTERVEANLKQYSQQWPALAKEQVDLNLVELERQFREGQVSEDDDNDAESAESSDDDDDSSSSSDDDDDDDDSDDESSSSSPKSRQAENISSSTTTALLDESMGTSILRVVATRDDSSLFSDDNVRLPSIAEKPAKSLIEEVAYNNRA